MGELLEDFKVYNRVRNLSDKTIVLYDYVLRGFLEWLGGRNPLSVTPRDVRDWLAERLQAGLSPSTVKVHLAIVGSFYSFLVADDLMGPSDNPVAKVPSPRTRRPVIPPLTDDQVRAFLSGFEGPFGDRNRAMCLLMLDTGLRAGEIAGLAVHDINFKERRLKVIGKGDKQRWVYMGEKVTEILEDYAANRARNGPRPLFLSRGGGRMTSNSVSKVVQRRMRSVGIPRANSAAHRLRHTFAVNFLRGEGGVFHLQRLLGHSSLAMTRRYVMLAEDDLQEAHRKASPVDRMMSEKGGEKWL